MAKRIAPQRPSTRSAKKEKIRLGVLIIISLFFGGFLVSMIKGGAVEAKVEKKPEVGSTYGMVKIDVPTSQIKVGSKLSKTLYKKVHFPEEHLPEDAVTDIAPYLNATALAALPANVPILKQNISLTKSATNPILERIPDNMRAITLKVDVTSAVEGWAGTGAIIDVLRVNKEASHVVAEKVKILSAHRSIEQVSEDVPKVPSTVTLLVTQEQSLAIKTAEMNGKLAFALRSMTDEGNWQVTKFSKNQLDNESVKPTGTKISGYVSVSGGKGFALLSDGKWVRSDIAPDGTLDALRD